MKATRRGSLHCLYTFQKQSLHPYGKPLFPRGSPKYTSKQTAGQTLRSAPTQWN